MFELELDDSDDLLPVDLPDGTRVQASLSAGVEEAGKLRHLHSSDPEYSRRWQEAMRKRGWR